MSSMPVAPSAGAVPACPLCDDRGATAWSSAGDRDYWRCPRCALVFLSPAQRLARDAELARYALHQNRDDDPDYLAFLSRLAEHVLVRTPPGATGLDYGSGSSAALAQLLTRAGRPTVAYDPEFRPDDGALAARYDFVTCCEVLEHVHRPLDLFDRVAALLEPGGLIGVMTGMYSDDAAAFADWWYRRDPTHVCFYHPATFHWVAATRGWRLDLPAPNVAILTVPTRVA